MMKTWLCVALLPVVGAAAWAGQVTGLTLIDAATDQPIGPLNNGDVVDLSTTDRGINVRADVAGDVRSVRFGVNNNANFKTESVAPFALRGDNQGDYSEWAPAPGEYTVTATPYALPNAGGTPGTPLTVAFRVQGQPRGGNVGPPEVPSQYPDIASEQELGTIPPTRRRYGRRQRRVETLALHYPDLRRPAIERDGQAQSLPALPSRCYVHERQQAARRARLLCRRRPGRR